MAKKKMIDVKQVGQFLFKKGERLGLAVSGVILLMFLALGLLAGAAPKDWVKDLNETIKRGRGQLDAPRPDEQFIAQIKNNNVPIDWPARLAKDIPSQVGWGAIEEVEDTKRRNPSAKPILEREIQLDYVQGARFVHDIDLARGEASTLAAMAAAGTKQANITPLRTIQPSRMIICTAAFPYREQLEDFQKNLRIPDISQLLASKDDIPKFLGLIVKRIEVVNDKDGEAIDLFTYDAAKEEPWAAPHIANALRESIYQTVPAELRRYVRPGLVTPLPEMAIGVYPSLDLPTIKAEAIFPLGAAVQGKKPFGFPFPVPMGNPQVDAGGQINKVLFSALSKSLQEKFTGKLAPFDPYEGNDPLKNVGAVPVRPEIPNAGGDLPDGSPEKLLVRFFDLDVQPGSTYRYTIQVRLHNPNYGKHKEVRTLSLADIKEFYSEVKKTPTITVPREQGLYAIDQSPLESKSVGTEKYSPIKADFAPVQLHRWVEKSESGNRVGDWAVAERLLIRKGETIGRSEVIAEVPEWIDNKERFEVAKTPFRNPFTGKTEDRPGIRIDFRIGNPSPILVDYTGGKRKDYRDELLKVQVPDDDAEINLLILDSEGKLRVRSSAIDANEQTPTGRIRLQHYNQWRERLRQHTGGGAADPKQKGGGLFPGL